MVLVIHGFVVVVLFFSVPKETRDTFKKKSL